MKTWILAALVTGLVAVPLMMRKHSIKVKPAATSEEDKRYDIEEYISEDEL